MSDTDNLPPEGHAERARALEAAGRWTEAAAEWTAARVASAGHKRRDRYAAAAKACRAKAAAEAPEDWLVHRWTEGPAMHGHSAWWHHRRGNWTQERDMATPLTQLEAERLAEDWQSWSDTKGAGYVFTAEPVQDRKG